MSMPKRKQRGANTLERCERAIVAAENARRKFPGDLGVRENLSALKCRREKILREAGPGYEGRVEIATVSVDNPYREGPPKIDVHKNIRHDALENEYARKRISLTAYMAGRVYQGTWDDNREAAAFCMERINIIFSANDIPIILGIDKAKRVNELRDRAKVLLGPDRERLVNKILSDNKGIEEIALEEGYSGTKQRYYVGETFRQSLEILGDAWFCS